jgi:hypothetical protein
MDLFWSVHTNADIDPVLMKYFGPFGIEKRSVRLKVKLQLRDILKNAACLGTPASEPPGPDQAWLTTVKHQIQVALTGQEAMAMKTAEHRSEYVVRHQSGTALPRGICLVVHVTIRAIQIAA